MTMEAVRADVERANAEVADERTQAAAKDRDALHAQWRATQERRREALADDVREAESLEREEERKVNAARQAIVDKSQQDLHDFNKHKKTMLQQSIDAERSDGASPWQMAVLLRARTSKAAWCATMRTPIASAAARSARNSASSGLAATPSRASCASVAPSVFSAAHRASCAASDIVSLGAARPLAPSRKGNRDLTSSHAHA